MLLSARNQLQGEVVEVNVGDIMAHTTVQVGENQIESIITRRSAEQCGFRGMEQLGLKQGDTVTVVIKSIEVMLQKS